MREAVAAIQNKVGQFASNPLIRNIVGQVESAVDLREIMDQEKIFIVNISKGRIGEENSRLLGAMIVTRIYLAAMGRINMPESERRDFYLYVDEFQNFATESFASILSEARKYHLNLTIAHQYIAQMEEEVQHAIFGNVGTMVLFRTGAEDAELFEKEFMPEFTAQDLVNLGFKNIYVKLMIDGITSRPFSAETLAPFPAPAVSNRDTLIRASRERYGTPRAMVEDRIRRFTEGNSEQSAAISEGSPAITSAPKPKDDRPMFETRCAECGTSVLVPFKPDGVRPVYCEEHMEKIKFRSKGGGGEGALKEGQRPAVQPAKKPVSLASLRSQNERREGRQPQPEQQKPRRRESPVVASGAHLGGLRKALDDALRPRESDEPTAPEHPAAASAARPAKLSPPLAPGEVIRFE